MQNPNDIVVTGMGVCSPIGSSVPVFWRALCDGQSGIRPLTRLKAERYLFRQAGEIRDIPIALPGEPPTLGPAYRFVRAAIAEAIEQASSASDTVTDNTNPVGLVLATNFGDNQLMETWLQIDHKFETPAAVFETGFQSVADRLAAQFGFSGPRTVLSLSCASGGAAVAVGADWIRSGRVSSVLVGGYDALSDFWWSGLSALRAMSPDALRPFDSKRDGTIFGEGAAVLMLEDATVARRRGAVPHARFAGSGLTNNAFHMTAPDKEAAGLQRAMKMAIDDAGIRPEMIDHVNCHGTATRYNDVTETQAIKNVLGSRARDIPVTANKSMTSHTMGAAGAMEAVASIMTLQTGMVPPTINLREQDPACDLDVTPHRAAQHDVATVLSNSAGIGGCNAALVFQRANMDRR